MNSREFVFMSLNFPVTRIFVNKRRPDESQSENRLSDSLVYGCDSRDGGPGTTAPADPAGSAALTHRPRKDRPQYLSSQGRKRSQLRCNHRRKKGPGQG